jgi:hypothetical protein
MTTLWVLLAYWLVVFVGCYVVTEIGQDQLYDEVTPYVGWKVGGASLILAVMLTAFYQKGAAASFDTMFTTNFIWTVLQAIVWFAVFTLILQFHPWHALGIGIVTMLLVQGLASMLVASLMTPTPTAANQPGRVINQPVRGSMTPPPPSVEPRPAEAKPEGKGAETTPTEAAPQ